MYSRRFSWSSCLTILLLILCGTGCSTENKLRAQYAKAYNCPKWGTTRFSKLGQHRFLLEGCAGRQVYLCKRVRVASARTWSCAVEEQDTPAAVLVAASGKSEQLVRRKNDKGQVVLTLHLVFGLDETLALFAMPTGRPAMQVAFTWRESKASEGPLGLMADGARVPSTEAVATEARPGLRRMSTYVERDAAMALAGANELALRLGAERWSLSPEQLARVRQFMTAWKEELAWAASTSPVPPASAVSTDTTTSPGTTATEASDGGVAVEAKP
ncbi:MAG: hypothetical protein QM778_22120 [Myxococcales bacterium]